MPELIPNKKFVSDLENFNRQKTILKKIAKTLNFLEGNPTHPGLRIERIFNDPGAWAAHVDKNYRISFEPTLHPSTCAPDWTAPVKLLRVLDHDDLYRSPR